VAAGDATVYAYENLAPVTVNPGHANVQTYFYVAAPPLVLGDGSKAFVYAYFDAQVPPVVPTPGDPYPVISLAQWPPDDAALVVTPVSAGERSDSAVLLNDGRVLYVFVDGTSIKQGYSPSVTAFLTQNGSVTDITTIVAGVNGSNCCVFSEPGGGVFLVTSVNPVAGSNPDFWGTRVWRSPSELGGDWAYRGVVQRLTSPEAGLWINMGSDEKAVGQPAFSGARWLLPAPKYVLNQLGDPVWYKHQAVWSSDDAGYTWTERVAVGHHIVGGPYGIGESRNVAGKGGRLFWTSTDGSGAVTSELRYSDDGGATWSAGDPPAHHIFYNFPLRDDTYLYRFDGAGVVMRSATPGNGTGPWEAWRDYPMSAGHGHIVQPLGADLAYMHDGKVLGFRGSAGRVKVWDGSAWLVKPVKVWDGAAWLVRPVKVWDGSAWAWTS
jgi:hypothetical protein